MTGGRLDGKLACGAARRPRAAARLGADSIERTKGGHFRKYAERLRIASTVKAGTYDLTACVRRGSRSLKAGKHPDAAPEGRPHGRPSCVAGTVAAMRRVLMGLQFFPRGGSAHVVRNLARTLPAAGWDARLVSGSLTVPGRPGDAREFYARLDVRPVDMTEALASGDPMRAEVPLHPSYEDRPEAPDRVFAE